MIFDIKEYGAVGNGVAWDAPAIQQALDAACAAGGGRVIVPPGTYLAANIKLRDNVTLYLENGSRIKSPESIDPYEADESVNPCSQHHYLISGRNVKNAVIDGDGVIDGSGNAFWLEEFCNATARRPKNPRPTMIYCIDCRNLKIRNIRIENASVYTVWLLGCQEVLIDGVVIRNDREGPNTDALDIDCCSNVRICNCDIVAGDDCIALKSDIARLGREAVCENVVVSNCVFSSSTCAIRIGYEGDGVIRDCIFSNLTCYDCAKVIAMQSLAAGDVKYTVIKKGTLIENMQFANFTLRNVDRAFFIRAGNDLQESDYAAAVRNISITNISGTVKKESFIGGTWDYFVDGLLMRDINLQFIGAFGAVPGEFPGIWGHSTFPPVPFALRFAKNVLIENMKWDFAGRAIQTEMVENCSVNGTLIN